MSGRVRVSLANNGTAPGRRVSFWCPGCDRAHSITIEVPGGWGWDGDPEGPTFEGSVKVGGVQWETASGFHKPRHAVPPGGEICCHSFVMDGWITFLGDCTHVLAGQTVLLPLWDDHKREPTTHGQESSDG